MSKLVPYLAVFAGIILCAIVIPGAVDTLDVALSFDDFQRTQARVISKRAQKHARGPDTMSVEFEFVGPNGETIRADNALTRFGDAPELIEELVVREKGVDRVVVYYDRANPNRVVLREVSIWPSLGLIGLTLLLLFGGVHASMIDRRRRQLQARGDAARVRREQRRGNDLS